MKRSKKSHINAEVVRMGHLMRHIRLNKNIAEQTILKEMGITHACYWAMEAGQQRQSYADLMRFAAATHTDMATNMIASLSGNFDLALHGAENRIGAWAIGLLAKIHMAAGKDLAQLNLEALEKSLMSEATTQIAALSAANVRPVLMLVPEAAV